MSSVKRIAEMANVSVATVSRVLHNSEKVKPETRRRVDEVIKQLGAKPDELIRGNKPIVIGVVVPDLSNNFFTEVIAGIQKTAQDRNVNMFICNTQEDERTEIQYLQLLKNMRINGLIITPVSDEHDSANSAYLQLLKSMNIPIVLLDRDVKYSNYDGVFIDNVRGAFEATRSLIENGHTRIAIISGPMNTKPGRERLQGYKEAFLASGMEVDRNLIFHGDFSLESGKRLVQEVLDKHPDITAIFSANNLMTLGCLDTLTRAGKSVPEDMSVLGFDNINALEMLGMRLSVVDRPTFEMGCQSMKLLAKAMDHQNASVPRRITLMPKLVLKGSERKYRTE